MRLLAAAASSCGREDTMLIERGSRSWSNIDTEDNMNGPEVVLSRYPIPRCNMYRDTWVTMRYVS